MLAAPQIIKHALLLLRQRIKGLFAVILILLQILIDLLLGLRIPPTTFGYQLLYPPHNPSQRPLQPLWDQEDQDGESCQLDY